MDILSKIKPSQKEEDELKSLVKDFIQKIKIKDAKAVFGGSGAKGTWLRDQGDADIFVKFNLKKYKNKDISKIIEKELMKKFKKAELIHGSRNYFNVNYKGFVFEVIPILDIKKASEALNITDISPLHASWVIKKSNERIRDEIRKFKYFLKINGLYGAESYVKGFSGYAAEILIIYYKSFDNLIKNARKWKEGKIIDVEHHDSASSLNESKISPLIIIDPVQEDRNAAAALSREKFLKLIELSRKKISFEEKKINLEDYDLVLEIIPKKNKKDVMGAKSLKVFEYLKKNLNKFDVKDSYFKFDSRALLCFKLGKKELERYREHQGPPVKLEENVKAFLRKYKDKTYINNGRYYAKLLNKNRKFKDYVKELLKEKHTKDGISRIVLK